MECATDFLQTLWDIFKAAIGVLFGAVVGWIAARFSDALRERQAERQRLESYLANLELLTSTLDNNLGFMDIIHDQATSNSNVTDEKFTVTERLHFTPVADIIRQLINCGADRKVIEDAQKAIQKMEVVAERVEILSRFLQDPSWRKDDFGTPFKRALRDVRNYTRKSEKFYTDLKDQNDSLKDAGRQLEEKLSKFEEEHPLFRYMFKF